MYTIYKDNQNLWRWNYKSNGRIIGASSESYHNKSDCENGIRIMKNSGSNKENYTIYKDSNSLYRWRFTSNGRIIATSGEAYYNRIDCENGIRIMIDSKNSL
jgi:uncharacterized protein YegP (UPF0339 family)